jgi:hypothetical protein
MITFPLTIFWIFLVFWILIYIAGEIASWWPYLTRPIVVDIAGLKSRRFLHVRIFQIAVRIVLIAIAIGITFDIMVPSCINFLMGCLIPNLIVESIYILLTKYDYEGRVIHNILLITVMWHSYCHEFFDYLLFLYLSEITTLWSDMIVLNLMQIRSNLAHRILVKLNLYGYFVLRIIGSVKLLPLTISILESNEDKFLKFSSIICYYILVATYWLTFVTLRN